LLQLGAWVRSWGVVWVCAKFSALAKSGLIKVNSKLKLARELKPCDKFLGFELCTIFDDFFM
jgi:hypothetical protein